MDDNWIVNNIVGGQETIDKIGEAYTMDDNCRVIDKATSQPTNFHMVRESDDCGVVSTYKNIEVLGRFWPESLVQESICIWERNQRKREE